MQVKFFNTTNIVFAPDLSRGTLPRSHFLHFFQQFFRDSKCMISLLALNLIEIKNVEVNATILGFAIF
jgi:hypothetical protein